jgi:sulfate adenylyltransferase
MRSMTSSIPESPALAGAAAHSGQLTRLIVCHERARQMRAESRDWLSWELTERQLCDVELLLNGGFSPLTGFLTRRDYDAVCQSQRLSDGTLWPVPVVLDISEALASKLKPGQRLALRDPEGVMLAALRVEEIWQPERVEEACLIADMHPWLVGGRVEGLQLPVHHDFPGLRRTPRELRFEFARRGWDRIAAFHTEDPMHRPEFERARRGAAAADASLLIHPIVGPMRPGHVDPYTRVRCYEAVARRCDARSSRLAVLPYAPRTAGTREALLHAIIRKNYGCTHFIAGSDKAIEDCLIQHQAELGLSIVPFQEMVYVDADDAYAPKAEVESGASARAALSEREVQERLADGDDIPQWFTFPDVAAELQRRYPPRHERGFTVFLTGLSGAGKSTIANVLRVKFQEKESRHVTLLDGDLVRKNLSSELGFSKEHRDLNIRRIGYVASEITKNGGIAICAPIAPYDETRKHIRRMIEPLGGFILVHVATSAEVCEQRDRKGLYAKARGGLIPDFTGVNAPYEAPQDADVVIDTEELSPEQAVEKIIGYLEQVGYMPSAAAPAAMERHSAA